MRQRPLATPHLTVKNSHVPTASSSNLPPPLRSNRPARALSYYYNRRTRVPRWTLPPMATYVPDPQRPAGYRIFALATTAISVKKNNANATGSSSSNSSSSAKETAEERACAASGTAVGKGSSSHEGYARALRESGAGNGGDGAEDSPPTALLLSTATPATATMTTTGGTPSSPQSFPPGTTSSSSSTAAAEARTATRPSAAVKSRSPAAAPAPAAQRFVVHKSGLWASSSQPAAPTSAAAAATPPEATPATAATPATLPTVTPTTDNNNSNNNNESAAQPNPETSAENAPPSVPQIDPGVTTAPTTTTACLAVGTHEKSVEPAATPSTPQATTAGGRRSDEPLADTAPPAAQKAADTGLVGGDSAAELGSEGLSPASTVSEDAVDDMPPRLEAPEGGGAGGDAESLGGPPSPAEAGPTPDSVNRVNGCETAMVIARAAAPVDVPATLTAATMAAVEGDGSEAQTMAAPPAGVTPVSTAAVDLDASLKTTTFEAPARREVDTEDVSKGPAVTATASGTAVADAERGSTCQVLFLLSFAIRVEVSGAPPVGVPSCTPCVLVARTAGKP